MVAETEPAATAAVFSDTAGTGPDPDAARRGPLELVRESPLALFGLAGVLVLLFWAPNDAGFDPLAWYPGGIAFLAVLAGIALTAGRELALPRWLVVALATFAAFAVLNYASIGWAADPGIAFAGANRTLLYLLVFAAFAAIPWTERTAVAVVAVYCAGVAAVAAVTVLDAAHASHLDSFFVSGRFSSPAGYPNANAALFLSAAWPSLYLASRRSVPILLRAGMLAVSGTLFDASLLCQSRGGVLATVITAPLFLALVPRRGRTLVAMGAVAVTTAISGPAALAVYSRTGDGDRLLRASMRTAAERLGVGALVLAVIGLAWAALDRRVELGPRLERTLRRALAAAAVALVVVGVAGVAAFAHPRSHLDRAWSSFRHGQDPQGSSRFVGLGSNRYDFYRVSVAEFRHHLLLGVGSDNFAIDYVRDRRSDEEPLYPHSAVLRVPAQTGLAGSALGLAFLAALGLGLVRARGTPAWPLVAGLMGSALYLAIHGAVDWFWEFPGLAGAAFMFVGIAAGLAPRGVRERAPAPAVRLWLGRAGLSAVAAAVLVALVPAWLSARDVSQASSVWRTSPETAYAALDRAAKLDPWSADPYLVAGTIAGHLGDDRRLRSSFAQALERVPRSWFATLELGAAEARLGNDLRARALLARAHRLDPLEETVTEAEAALRRGRPLSFARLDAIFQARVERRIGSGLRPG